MSIDPAYQYQMFQIYLGRAREAEAAGKKEQARKLYLLASESLLAVARSNDGEIRAGQLQNVELLISKAKALAGEGGQPQASGKAAKGKDGEPAKAGPFAAVEVPDVSFDDIAGLEEVKQEVRERVLQPIQRPDIYKQFGIKPGGGILMFGLPGTGKTMVARAIAKEVKAPFYYINASDIKDKYVGSSERNIAALFEQVRSEQAAVIFFDEFDGLGGKASDDSSSSRGILAELKSQIDGFDKGTDSILLLIAATNKPWDIDTAFLRSGRFSKMLYVPLPDEAARRFLLKKNLGKAPLEEDVDLEKLVSDTHGFNAADVVELCVKAKLQAASRSVQRDQISKISAQDLEQARSGFRSTVAGSDIQDMHKFMRENGFEIPEQM